MDMRATAPDGHGILKIPNPVQSYPEPPDLSKALGGEMYKVSVYIVGGVAFLGLL